MTKALVILSAHAGKGGHESARDVIAREFRAAGIDVEFHEIHEGDKADEIVRARLRHGFDLVVAAGGDGTVSRVFDGLYESSVPLGIVPIGTGNLIARELNIPMNMADAVALVVGAPRAMKIDAMRVGKRVCVLNAGIGFNAAVIANTSRKDKKRWGVLAYFATGVKMTRLRPRSVYLTVDGVAHQHRAVDVAISNCGVIANTLYPSGPVVRCDDGQLDIWILSMDTFMHYVGYVVGMMFGRRAKGEFLTAKKRITVTSRTPLTAQADGDIIGTTPLDIEMLPGALTVLVPGTARK